MASLGGVLSAGPVIRVSSSGQLLNGGAATMLGGEGPVDTRDPAFLPAGFHETRDLLDLG